MIEPTERDINRKVIYRAAPFMTPEEGVITSFNREFVFVRYGKNTHSTATPRKNLEWTK